MDTKADRKELQKGHPTADSNFSTVSADHLPEDSFAPAPRDFGRFQNLEFLGQGGMGRVYRAFDPTLHRLIALKLLRTDDPALGQRFVQEARSQAQVDHPNVCKVFEAGVINQRPYIAMQFISGTTLKEACKEMTFSELARLMEQVARGVASAHQAGIIHRDLKPANILVQKSETHDSAAYVMDFGLARELSAPGMTATGLVLGTPAYMSPEQAMGDASAVDQRSDVYSIGATLYEITTGHPPFQGSTHFEILQKVIETDPLPPRKRIELIPSELETITLKCLEKDPVRRYSSAIGVAEDLRRFREGETISARRSTWLYRSQKKFRKHPWVSLLLSVAVILVLSLAVLWIRSTWQTKEQLRLASQFGEEIRYVEDMLRHSYTGPFHDVRSDEKQARTRLGEFEKRSRNAPVLVYGPANYALGRGYFALHDYKKAAKYLEQAWFTGYHIPQAAYAFGLCLAMIYANELESARHVSQEEFRKARILYLEQIYRDRALDLIRAGHASSTDAPEYGEAIIAFLQKDYATALKKSEVAYRKMPWLYEARKLQGDIYLALATGLPFWESESLLQNGENALIEVIQRSPSDAQAYLAVCRIQIEQFTLNGNYEGLDRARNNCENAIRVNPEMATAYAKLAFLYRIWAEALVHEGKNGEEMFSRSLQAANTSLQLDQQNTEAYQSIYWINVDRDHAKSLAILKKLVTLDPSMLVYTHQLAQSYSMEAHRVARQGGDSLKLLGWSVQVLENGIRAEQKSGWQLLGSLFWEVTDDWFDERINQGQKPRAEIFQTFKKYDTWIQNLKSPSYEPYYAVSRLQLLLADLKLADGTDPSSELAESQNALNKSLQQFKSGSFQLTHPLEYALRDLRWRRIAGRDSRGAFEKSMKGCANTDEFAQQVRGASSDLLAEFSLLHAEYLTASSGRNYEKDLETGIIEVEKALKEKPNSTRLLAVKGSLFLLRSRLSNRNQPGIDREKALDNLRTALKRNPNLSSQFEPYLH